MNHVNDWQHGGCGRSAERLLMCRVLIPGVLLLLSSAPSRGSDGDPASVAGQRGGVNQSLSLDHEVAVPTPDAVDSSAGPPAGRLQAHQDTDDSKPVDSKPVVESRTLQRHPTGRTRAMESRVAGVPWYRTGLGALVIVLGAVIGVFFLLRRWIPSARMVDNGILRVVGRTPLTPKQHIALVKVGRRFVAVGVSPDRVDALCEISDPEEVADLTVRGGAQTARGGNFDEWLFREAAEYCEPVDRLPEERPPSSAASRSPKPLKDLLHRLRKMKSQ